MSSDTATFYSVTRDHTAVTGKCTITEIAPLIQPLRARLRKYDAVRIQH